MSEKVDTTISLLTQFGVSDLEAKIYLDILSGRGDTALAISRNIKVSRTKVYRLLDNLILKKLVISRVGDRGTRFVVSPIDQLGFLISDKTHELEKLRQALPILESQLIGFSNKQADSPKILYYHGLDGLKQVTYNSLKAKGELLTYELSTLNAFFTQSESEDLRERFVANRVHIRTLTSASRYDAWTNVAEMVEKYCEIRHLDKPFEFEILIYNDVYCMYHYVGDEVFCLEIYSQELADMQRQIFEYLWSGARKFKVLDSHGTAELLTYPKV